MAFYLGLVNWEGNYILGALLGFCWIVFVWERYLGSRQRAVYKKAAKPPQELAKYISQETFEKSRSYKLDTSWFGFLQSSFNHLVDTCAVAFGAAPLIWRVATDLLVGWGYSADNEILISMAVMIMSAVVNVVLSLPWTVYHQFVIEERHGFNKQTAAFFIKDQIKSFVVGQAISLPILSALIWIIQTSGDNFFVYCWLFSFLVSLFLISVYPDYIAPLFDTYEPLPEGTLKTQIEALASSLKFPLTKIFVVEGSKRSAHSNAYLYGFFNNKRIVLFDTLIQDYQSTKVKDKPEDASEEPSNKDQDALQGGEVKSSSEVEETKESAEKKGCSNEEILAILCHEIGHWYHSHVLTNFVISQVNTFVWFLLLSLLINNTELYEAFGVEGKPTMLGLYIVFSYVLSPLNEFLGFCLIALTRRFEYQADRFAKRMNRAGALRQALIKLEKDNLSFPHVDWLFSMWKHSHPHLTERLAALKKTE